MSALVPEPVLLALLLAAGLAFAAAARRRARWPRRRTAAAVAGLAALGLAMAPVVDERAGALLSMHMVQHALLALVAAPLLVASAPVRLALGTLPRAPRRRLARLLHGRALRALARPLPGLAIFVVALAVVHLPPVYEAALRAPLVHAATHALLLWSAIALWVPLVGADPIPRQAGAVTRVGVLIAAMAAMGALGAALAALPRLAYPAYAAPTIALGHDPLADQVLAGGIMWVGGMVVVLPALLALAWRALSAEERAQLARERALRARELDAAGSGG